MDGSISARPDDNIRANSSNRAVEKVRRRRLRSDLIHVLHDFLVVWDIASVGLTGFACAVLYQYLSLAVPMSPDFIERAGRIAIVGAILAPFVLTERRQRQAIGLVSPARIIAHTARTLSVFFVILLGIGFLTRSMGSLPSMWAIGWVVTAFVVTVTGRLLLRHWLQRMRSAGVLSDRVAIVGGGPVAEQLLRHLNTMRDSGVRVVAVFNDILAGSNAKSDHGLCQLIQMGQRNEVDRVIVTLPASDEARVFEIVYRLKVLDVEVAHCPSLMGIMGALPQITQVAGAPLIVLTSRPMERWGMLMKGIEDRVLAGLLLVLLAPLLAITALAVRLDTPGPVIFRQRRHGWNGTEFFVFKFRTMQCQQGASAGNGEVQTKRQDSRITRVGGFLRRTSLDELPQLFNVLNGTMSLVGPRPHPVVMRTEQQLGEEIIAEYSHRHRVKPGVTGWAQINGHRGATETAEQVRNRVMFDIYYIDNWSLLFDLKILALTPYKVLFQRSNAF